MVGCSKSVPAPDKPGKEQPDDKKPDEKNEEELKKEANDAAKADLIGKWKRESMVLKIKEGGELVATDNIFEEELPTFFEFTLTEFNTFLSPTQGDRKNSYTLDAETSSIILTDITEGVAEEEEVTHMTYELSDDKNNLSAVITFNNVLEMGDEYQLFIEIKRISEWPTEVAGEIADNKADQEVKATLVGKWERVDFIVDGFKNGALVKKGITDTDLLEELQKEMPYHFEFTMKKFIMHDLENNDSASNSYTLDSKSSSIVITDNHEDEPDREITEEDVTYLEYELTSDNNSLSMVFVFDEDLGDYDKLKVTVKLKRIDSFPGK